MSANRELCFPVAKLSGVGHKRAALLAKLGIKTVKDLLYHFPLRYEDRTRPQALEQLVHGQYGVFWGVIEAVQELKLRPKLTVLKALVNDGKGKALAVWYNQLYLKASLQPGKRILFTGRVQIKYGELTINVENHDLLSRQEQLADYAKIVPIYPTTAGLYQKVLVQLIRQVWESWHHRLPATLPKAISTHYQLPDTPTALKEIHLPTSIEAAAKARKALAYEELLLWQIRLNQQRLNTDRQPGVAHGARGPLTKKYLELLPFSLTVGQRQVLREIFIDMEKPSSMARLLQGDVGSGKTVIALCALLKALDNGRQGALMAPTEILAEQHYMKNKEKLEQLGVRIVLLTGSVTGEQKEGIRRDLATGMIQLIIGTHALIQEEIKFNDLGAVVIDEQHRFGVGQRGQLLSKGVAVPDLLVMTATPIPRTLALTFYGDLDLSIIDELPPGRLPITTRYVAENRRQELYNFIKEKLDEGRQAYIVCPLVEDSDKIEAEAATALYEELRRGAFSDYRLGLVYGRMSGPEKEQVMADFRQGSLDLLVATTVIEVGVDIPNANIILINGCERFGLAQLHQLRGRVGRGEHQSFCFLMGRPKSEESRARIKIMINQKDGFSLAEEDLKLRGPGDFFGVRQHGLPQFQAADLLRDHKILELARDDARIVLSNSQKPEYRRLIQQAATEFANFLP